MSDIFYDCPICEKSWKLYYSLDFKNENLCPCECGFIIQDTLGGSVCCIEKQFEGYSIVWDRITHEAVVDFRDSEGLLIDSLIFHINDIPFNIRQKSLEEFQTLTIFI